MTHAPKSHDSTDPTAACKLCGRDPAEGFAKIGDDRYCHGDGDHATCYMRAVWDSANLDKYGFAVGRSGRAPF